MARKTKQEQIDYLEMRLERTHATIDRLAAERDALQRRNDSLQRIENEAELQVWLASAAKGQPVCVAGYNVEDPSQHISVSVYHENGFIRGVELGDGHGNITAVHGWLPADVVMDEIRIARGERITI